MIYFVSGMAQSHKGCAQCHNLNVGLEWRLTTDKKLNIVLMLFYCYIFFHLPLDKLLYQYHTMQFIGNSFESASFQPY